MLSIRRMPVLLLTIVLSTAACGTTDPTPTPTRLATASPSPVTRPSASAGVSPAPTAGTEQDAMSVGAVVKTVSGDLRARSQPRVSDDSIKYTPLLPLGTQLQVIGGPVEASGYTWYQVEPLDFSLAEGVTRVWVAAADHDGTPWIGGGRPGDPGPRGRGLLGRAATGRREGGEERRIVDHRVRHRLLPPDARRPIAWPQGQERGVLADQHRPRPRDGPGRREGPDRDPDRRGPPRGRLGHVRPGARFPGPGDRVA